jgi:hypothetical protein
MTMDLFAGIPVRVYNAAVAWYERLLGAGPSFQPHDTQAVWELADHPCVYIDVRPEHAGHKMHTLFVGEFDSRISQIAERGLEPSARPTPTASARPPSATRTATRSDSAARRPDKDGRCCTGLRSGPNTTYFGTCAAPTESG